jgi:hypothetical protein
MSPNLGIARQVGRREPHTGENCHRCFIGLLIARQPERSNSLSFGDAGPSNRITDRKLRLGPMLTFKHFGELQRRSPASNSCIGSERVSSNSKSFASKTKRLPKFGRRFSPHDPRQAPEHLLTLTSNIYTTALQQAPVERRDVVLFDRFLISGHSLASPFRKTRLASCRRPTLVRRYPV